jgi:hypothetical protein
LQAQQQLSDTWHTIIGSTAIAVVNTYLKLDKDLQSDEDRKQYTEEGLKDLKFLYSNAETKVPILSYSLILC